MRQNRHQITWRTFIEQVSVMRSDKFTDTERAAMVEAVSIAAPEGPRGMKCEDGCSEHSESCASAVCFMMELFERACSADHLSPKDRAELRTMLSQRGDLAKVKHMFPHVWRTLEELIR